MPTVNNAMKRFPAAKPVVTKYEKTPVKTAWQNTNERERTNTFIIAR